MGARYRDKLWQPFEDRGLKKRDLIVYPAQSGGSESPLLIEQRRLHTVEELWKKKCSWRFIFLDKHHSLAFMWNPASLIGCGTTCSVCCTWVLQLQAALPHSKFQSRFNYILLKEVIQASSGLADDFVQYSWKMFLHRLKLVWSVWCDPNIASFDCNQNTFLLPKIWTISRSQNLHALTTQHCLSEIW